MTHDEAKFLLHAYRPNGADSSDPALREALEHAHRDPALAAWFEREQAYDRAVAEKLRTIAPPPGLREALLAGGRVSTTTAWWRRPAWLAAAASIAILLTASFVWLRRGPTVSLDEATQFIVADMAGEDTHASHSENLGEVGAWLDRPGNRLAAGIPVDYDQLRKDRCRTVRVGGREMFEICFRRDRWYHVYIAPRRGFGTGLDAGVPTFRQQGALATATWADASNVYVLAAVGDMEALRSVL